MLDELAAAEIPAPGKPLPTGRLLTVGEFADYIQKGKRTVNRWIREGKLTHADGLRLLPNGEARINPVDWNAKLRILLAPLVAAARVIPVHHAALAVLLHSAHALLRHCLA